MSNSKYSIENLPDEHYRLLEEAYGCKKEKLLEMIDNDSADLDELIDMLAVDEVDDERIEEILDAICDCFEGPD